MNRDIAEVLSRYRDDWPSPAVEALGAAGGFSGAEFWRLASRTGPLCLRRWPAEHPTPERLEWIHRVLWHAHVAGVAILPVPLVTRDGASFVRHGGRLWELTAWLPGRAAERPVAPGRVAAAFMAVARLHLACADFAPPVTMRTGSPGLEERHERLLRLIDGDIHRLRLHCRPMLGGPWEPLRPMAIGVLESFDLLAGDVDRTLCKARELDVRIQPCVRDLRREHVLFSGEKVTGLIDFGSMRQETVAADVARLLIEVCGNDASLRELALTSYESLRPLDANERALLAAFEISGTLLGAINWLTWLFVDGRHFANHDAVCRRFSEMARRLAGLAEPFDEPDEAI
ncbi:MAG: phosphotransferase [Pirellulales bacterium]